MSNSSVAASPASLSQQHVSDLRPVRELYPVERNAHNISLDHMEWLPPGVRVKQLNYQNLLLYRAQAHENDHRIRLEDKPFHDALAKLQRAYVQDTRSQKKEFRYQKLAALEKTFAKFCHQQMQNPSTGSALSDIQRMDGVELRRVFESTPLVAKARPGKIIHKTGKRILGETLRKAQRQRYLWKPLAYSTLGGLGVGCLILTHGAGVAMIAGMHSAAAAGGAAAAAGSTSGGTLAGGAAAAAAGGGTVVMGAAGGGGCDCVPVGGGGVDCVPGTCDCAGSTPRNGNHTELGAKSKMFKLNDFRQVAPVTLVER